MRRASPDDADIVAAVTDATYATYLSRLGRKPQPMTADYRHLLDWAEHQARKAGYSRRTNRCSIGRVLVESDSDVSTADGLAEQIQLMPLNHQC